MDRAYKFRALLYDIHKHLRIESIRRREKEPGRIYYLYRGQALSTQQLEQLNDIKGCANEFFAFNSFASTSISQEMGLAMTLSNSSNNPDLVLVLFEIMIDTAKTMHGFADISHYSQHPDEKEILIDIGAIMSIDEVIPPTSGMHVTSLILSYLQTIDDLFR